VMRMMKSMILIATLHSCRSPLLRPNSQRKLDRFWEADSRPNPFALLICSSRRRARLKAMPAEEPTNNELFYCPRCAAEVPDPLTCGDCGAVICRRCGTILESASELGIG